ncbi:glycoside hydrolase family 53 protein [Pseudaeromonas paramecii]|uniref:Arabinogalactan endo-beta-1,4-galactanase n=1 Tax=Pseudaeromonas paramecii TaxID=2138166 RepID=A0ABP8QHG5_9GAMM
MSHFIRGADMSSLPELEYHGGVLRANGQVVDGLKLLHQAGLNAVRIKVWNDPGNPDHFPANQSGPQGFNSPAQALALGRRATAAGLQVMLDFHYSDWWADPAKQFMPQAWQGLTLPQVCQALHGFTAAVLSDMQRAGVDVRWVQVGNEISHGMVWPLGFLPGNWPALAALLRAGVAAVREVAPGAQVVLHLDSGCDQDLYLRWFEQAQALDVGWDCIGLSFYPCWHGALPHLAANLHQLAARFGCPLLVVETAYPRQLDPQRNGQWLLQHTGSEPYPATPQGQAQFLHALAEVVRAVPGGLGQGIFYWEPALLPLPDGSRGVWQNATLFDDDGVGLPGLAALGQV